MSIYNHHPYEGLHMDHHMHMDPHCDPHHMEHHILHNHEPYNLINQYNKVCFKNYDEAVSILKNKQLLPGELSFAYYFDRGNVHGVNAICAVGSIKLQGTNIIFDNIDNTLGRISTLQETVCINNEKIMAYKNTLDSLKDKINKFDLVEHIISHNNMQNNMQNASINVIESTIHALSDFINTNTARLNDVDEQIDQFNSYIEDNEANLRNINVSILQNSEQIKLLDEKIDLTVKDASRARQKISDDICKWVNSSLVEYVDSLTLLRSDIDQKMTSELLPIKTDIYDIKQYIDTLDKKIINSKADIISYTKEYIPLVIDNKLLNVNNNITLLTNLIHIQEDNIYDVSKNTKLQLDSLTQFVNKNIESVCEAVNTSLNTLNNELGRLRTYLRDTMESFKSEYSVLTDSKIANATIKLLDSINKLSNKVESADNILNSKVTTINTTFDTYKAEVTEQINSQLGDILTNMRNYINTAVSDDRTYYDNIYARKDMMPQSLIAGNGIVINNGVISLNVDSNGLLMVNGKRYLLTEL